MCDCTLEQAVQRSGEWGPCKPELFWDFVSTLSQQGVKEEMPVKIYPTVIHMNYCGVC